MIYVMLLFLLIFDIDVVVVLVAGDCWVEDEYSMDFPWYNHHKVEVVVEPRWNVVVTVASS